MKAIIIIISLFFLAISAFAQDKDEIINDIQSRIEDIHLDTSLKSVTLQNEEFLQNMTDGGGELTGFYKGDRIYRIYQSVGISYGVYITEYYFRKNQLMFVHDKFNSYVMDDSSGSFDYTKINTTFNGSYYFKDQKLIYSTSVGHNRFEGDNIDVEQTLLKESAEAFKYISDKIKSSGNK